MYRNLAIALLLGMIATAAMGCPRMKPVGFVASPAITQAAQ